jgi:hypothetical protein
MTSRFAVAAAAVIMIAAVACTITPNTGADAGVVDAGHPTGTIGGQCTRIETAYCQRALDCLATSQSLSQCVADGQIKCCADKCNNPALSPDVAIDACVAAIPQESCNDVVQGGSPSACGPVPKLK